LVKVMKVARNGYITIPAEFRRKIGLKEGSLLLAEVTEKGILFRHIQRLDDMTGKYSAHATPEEIKKEIDKLREEY
jgi:antitoxin PrlF